MNDTSDMAEFHVPAADTRARVLPPALKASAWKKGQSGNPSGRSNLYNEVQKLARERSPEALSRLADLMQSNDERVAVVACNSLLERAFGKPKEYDPAAEQPETPPIDPSQFTPQQRQMLRRMLQLLVNATPAIESE